jgi:hypothetical protein
MPGDELLFPDDLIIGPRYGFSFKNVPPTAGGGGGGGGEAARRAQGGDAAPMAARSPGDGTHGTGKSTRGR